MAFVSGRSAILLIGNSGNTLTNISAYLDDISHPATMDTPDVTVFGATAKAKIGALNDATFAIKGPWDPTFDGTMTGIYKLNGASGLSFQYGPQGSTTGYPRVTGNYLLKSYQTTAPVAGVVNFAATLEVTGARTLDTWT